VQVIDDVTDEETGRRNQRNDPCTARDAASGLRRIQNQPAK